MNIKRINSYQDKRFSQAVLNQHGCFLVDDEPYEVEIISDHEAVVRGRNTDHFEAVIEEFRFYTPHITDFYDKNRTIIKEFSPVKRLSVALKDIQPSQFYVDEDKIAAIRSFIGRYYYPTGKIWRPLYFSGRAHPFVLCGNDGLA